jgi:inner membrane protein
VPWLRAESRQARDLERFRRFSGGFLAIDPDRDDHVIDVRYSMVPNEIEALWGIRLARGAPVDAPATFYTERRATRETRSELVRMLFE